jgi:hypothetical protein
MARTKQEHTTEQHTVESTPELDNANAALNQQMANNLVINQQFGLELYNRERVESEIRFFMGQSMEALLNVGKLLIQLKENEAHGEWINSLGRIGIGADVAQRTMKAALKFSNTASTRLLEAAGNKTKLFELLVLDDEELAELNNGESLAGLQLDDVAKMSTTELRAALRKIRTDAKESSNIKDKIIGQKDGKINELTHEVEKLRAKKQAEPKPEPVFKPIGTEELEAVQKITTDINAKIGAELRFAIDRFYQAFGDDYPNRAMRLGLAHCIGHIITTLDDVAEAYRIQPEIDLKTADVDPAKADAEAFMKMMASDEPIVIDGLAEFNERMGITPANTKPVGEQFAEWEEDASLFDDDGNLKAVFTKE